MIRKRELTQMQLAEMRPPPFETAQLPNSFTSQQDRTSISIRSRKLLNTLLYENPDLKKILESSPNIQELTRKLRAWIRPLVLSDRYARDIYRGHVPGREIFDRLSGKQIAAIRILDYLDHSGTFYEDLNLRRKKTENHPFKVLWLAVHYGRGGAHANFFIDMIALFRQLSGKEEFLRPTHQKVLEWMARHPSGLDPEIIRIREKNKDRMIQLITDYIDQGHSKDERFSFPENTGRDEKVEMVRKWWDTRLFQLRFAARDPETLNEMLDHSLRHETLEILRNGLKKGIPVFVNPYYLSLLNLGPENGNAGADLPIRDYIFYSRHLLEEFGHIVAWEREDIVEKGKPNAAGWIIPSSQCIHRRYPDVAILIPQTMSRSCGGLCVSCQRMYDFQRGNLNFNHEKLKPGESWWEKLESLLDYFRDDPQLRDILITGGDALMSADKSLKLILDAVIRMAEDKRKSNLHRPEGEKFAEINRIRLGTRLPVYLPMRITDELAEILRDARIKGKKAGIQQFIIQTHFESAMEVTPDAVEAVRKILDAGWLVTNQQVFTASASRRGHTAKLRKVLNDIGVLPYYTFTVKGYMENYHNFATNARSVQEQAEEKHLGIPGEAMDDELQKLAENPQSMGDGLAGLLIKSGKPFLASDRNMLNLPGVGKSQSFRVIGITRYGRRILEFDHDTTRRHSPVIEKMGKVTIIESKPMAEYLEQLEEMGEDPSEYKGIFGYSIGATENRQPVFKYPPFSNHTTGILTNFIMDETD